MPPKISPRLEGKIYYPDEDEDKKPPKPKPKPPWTPPKYGGKNEPYTVKKGDTWHNIAEAKYGDQEMADKIVTVNPDVKKLKTGLIIDTPVLKPPTSNIQPFGGSGAVGLTSGQQFGSWLSRTGKQVGNWAARTFHDPDATAAMGQEIKEGVLGAGTAGYDLGITLPEGSAAEGEAIKTSLFGETRINIAQAAYEKRVNSNEYLISDVKPVDDVSPITGRRSLQRRGAGHVPMIGESPIYQLYRGKSPAMIDPQSQRMMKLTDATLESMGYEWDGEVWRRLSVIPATTPWGAGAYTGDPRRGRRGGGGGGGGGGRRVSGAPGTGGYKPPPGAFGLVTWKGL